MRTLSCSHDDIRPGGGVQALKAINDIAWIVSNGFEDSGIRGAVHGIALAHGGLSRKVNVGKREKGREGIGAVYGDFK